MIAKAWDRVRAFPSFVVRIQRAARRFNVSALVIWKRAVLLFVRYGIWPDEFASSGLVDPAVAASTGRVTMGKRRLMRYQRRFNPIQWECLVEDKAVFYAYCKALGLPVPEVYAVVDKKTGWTASGAVISERAEWEQFFEHDLPQEFVVKPAHGVYGRGVNVYRRAGASFTDASGRIVSAAALYEGLQTHCTYTRFVIQERVFNHPEIQRITGTRALQTVRISTWVTKSGQVEIYDSTHKFALGNNIIDNYDSGRSGNISSAVDPYAGVITALLHPSPDGFGYKELPVHPVTGVKIAGTILPHWSSARQLAERAARIFLPLRTIGWDIALAPDGPVLMEGNTWWDTFNHFYWSERRRSELTRFMSLFTTES
jgi:hypothetical protein